MEIVVKAHMGRRLGWTHERVTKQKKGAEEEREEKEREETNERK